MIILSLCLSWSDTGNGTEEMDRQRVAVTMGADQGKAALVRGAGLPVLRRVSSVAVLWRA